MGVKNGAFVKLWSAREKGKAIVCQASVSKKDKENNVYVPAFTGQLAFVGDCVEKIRALNLPEWDFEQDNNGKWGIVTKPNGTKTPVTIQITNGPDINTWVNPKTKKPSDTYSIYDFEVTDGNGGNKSQSAAPKKSAPKASQKSEDVNPEDDLPF